MKADAWLALAAPTPAEAVEWRIDGRPVDSRGKKIARFVAYVSAHYVRERLDAVAPGEWHFSLYELMPIETRSGPSGAEVVVLHAFKAELNVGGAQREDVGQGDDYKAAATDAFKRAGTRFGIGADLYSYEVNWVEVDDRGRPVEDPGVVYSRRASQLRSRAASGAPVATAIPAPTSEPAGAVSTGFARRDTPLHGERSASSPVGQTTSRPAAAPSAPVPGARYGPLGAGLATGPVFKCPVCGSLDYWDNRAKKASGEFKPRTPDYKCRKKDCTGAIWLEDQKPRGGASPVMPDVNDLTPEAAAWLQRVQPGHPVLASRDESGPGLQEPNVEEFDAMVAEMDSKQDDDLPF